MARNDIDDLVNAYVTLQKTKIQNYTYEKLQRYFPIQISNEVRVFDKISVFYKQIWITVSQSV